MKKVVSIFVVELAYLLGMHYVWQALGVTAWLGGLGAYATEASLLIQEIPIILILLLLNRLFWHQKLLFRAYPIGKSLAVLVLPLIFLLAGLGMGFLRWHQSAAYVGLMFVATLSIGAAEELAFRGLIFGILAKQAKEKLAFALAVSSVLFGLLHLVNLRHQPLENTLVQVFAVMAFGLFAAVLYVKTNNLLFSIILHGMNDFSAILASGGSTVSQQANPLSVLYEWLLFGTLAFAFYYTGWRQKQYFLARIKNAPEPSSFVAPVRSELAKSKGFLRLLSGGGLVYGLALLPVMGWLVRQQSRLPQNLQGQDPQQLRQAILHNAAVNSGQQQLLAILVLLAVALYVFIIIFFDFHLAQLCWLLFPYLGGPVFALLALVGGFRPMGAARSSKKSPQPYADKP